MDQQAVARGIGLFAGGSCLSLRPRGRAVHQIPFPGQEEGADHARTGDDGIGREKDPIDAPMDMQTPKDRLLRLLAPCDGDNTLRVIVMTCVMLLPSHDPGHPITWSVSYDDMRHIKR